MFTHTHTHMHTLIGTCGYTHMYTDRLVMKCNQSNDPILKLFRLQLLYFCSQQPSLFQQQSFELPVSTLH